MLLVAREMDAEQESYLVLELDARAVVPLVVFAALRHEQVVAVLVLRELAVVVGDLAEDALFVLLVEPQHLLDVEGRRVLAHRVGLVRLRLQLRR